MSNEQFEFHLFLLENYGMSYNAWLCLLPSYKNDLKSDFENGAVLSDYGKYLSRQHSIYLHQSDFTEWLRKHSVLSHSEFVNLPEDMKIKIYNNYWKEVKTND